MEISKKSVCVCKEYKQIKTKANIESDVIVPDTKPDIYRILSVKAVPDVSERYIKKDKIIFSGKTKFTVLYVGEGDTSRVFSIEHTAPFSHQADFSGVGEDFLCIGTSNVSNTVFEVKNSRKLSVGATLDLNAEAIMQIETDVIDAESELNGVETKSTSYTYDMLKAHKDFEITLTDTVMLPVLDYECEVYDISIRADALEIKTVNNKAIVKGNASIYITYSLSGELSSYDTETAFTEIVDIDDLSSDHTVFSHFETSEINWYQSPSDERTQIDIDFKFRGNICAYERCEYSVVSDIYSPDYNYSIKGQKGDFMQISKCDRTNFTLRDSITLNDSDSAISQIHCMETFVSVSGVNKNKDSIIVNGKTEHIIVYTDENGNLCRLRHLTPFETAIAAQYEGENSGISCDVICTNSGFTMPNSREIQLRSLFSADVKIVSLTGADFITDFNLDENSPLEKESQAGITVYYPEKGEEIWNVAKKYNTTSKDIIHVNSLDPTSKFLNDKPILIPKHHAN